MSRKSATFNSDPQSPILRSAKPSSTLKQPETLESLLECVRQIGLHYQRLAEEETAKSRGKRGVA
jgi:hypothetical protein